MKYQGKQENQENQGDQKNRSDRERRKDQKTPFSKIAGLYQQFKAESGEHSLFGIIYGAGLILALLSVLSAIFFIAWGG